MELAKFYEAILEQSRSKKEPEAKVLKAKDIFGEDKLVLIQHEDTVYRLMITRLGKLILNK